MLKKENLDTKKVHGGTGQNQGATGSSLQFTVIEDTPEYFEIDFTLTPNSRHRQAGAGSRSAREKEYGYVKVSKANFNGWITAKGENFYIGKDFITNNLGGSEAPIAENKDEIAKLQKVADDTSKTPKERDEARNKMYALKKKKKDILKEDWGSSDQSIMNRSIHKDLGEPENMPMPFDDQFESAVENAVDFYWDEWEEYQSDREGLIDHAKRAYYRAYFPEKYAGFQKMFSEEIETVQDPKTKEFTKREKISDKDKETIEKVQAMMAKEKAPTKEGLEGLYQITVSVRDAAKAHDIIRDMFRDDVEFSGSDVFNLTDKEIAHELYDTLVDAGIEVTDNNLQETIIQEEGGPYNPDDAPAVDTTGKKYSVGDILDFKGQLFQAQIGGNGRVILQHLDKDKKPTSKIITAEDPKFAAVLKSSTIVSSNYDGLDEANLNPELMKKVSRFVEGLAKYYGYSVESALYNINDALGQLYPSIREEAEPGADHEVSMADGQLQDIIKNATELKSKIGAEEKDLPGWIQDHISQSQNFINQANTGYHELETQPDPQQMALEGKKKGVDGKPCWDGYKYMGTKDGKDICVKM